MPQTENESSETRRFGNRREKGGREEGAAAKMELFARFRERELGLSRERTVRKHTIERASLDEIEPAFDLVTEYYQELGVEVREDIDQFEQQYFVEGTGVWLAVTQGEVIGCVALRKLEEQTACGEIKRMHVRAPHRGKGVADSFLKALEEYAANSGYEWLPGYHAFHGSGEAVL